MISRKEHVPTGRVAVEHVLQFLTEAYEVVPLPDDHEHVLQEPLERFERWRTWS